MNELKILSFTADGMSESFVTDTLPYFSFSYAGEITAAHLRVDGITVDAMQQIAVPCPAATLTPFTEYTAVLTVENEKAQDSAAFTFRTGRMDTPWQAQWITDGAYVFKEKKVSPKIMTFRKTFETKKTVAHAEIQATALGIYELILNGKFCPWLYFVQARPAVPEL